MQTTNIYPVVALRGKVAFPRTEIQFEVGREMTVKAVRRALATDRKILILTQRETVKDEITADDLYTVGCVAKVKQVTENAENAMRVSCEVLHRAKARVLSFDSGHILAVTDPYPTVFGDEQLELAHITATSVLVKEVLRGDTKLLKEYLSIIKSNMDAEQLLDTTAAILHLSIHLKQEVLEEQNLLTRFERLERILSELLEIKKLEQSIAEKVRKSIDKNQKDYYLREQLKAVHEELGDDAAEADEYRAKILEKKLPKDLETKCLKEIDRLSRMPSSAAEYTVIATYLDQVLSLPFHEETQDTDKLSDCKKVLDGDHYGLEKIKERITEYLAVLKLTGSMKAPILCLVGPPGVGKTSIAQSIARALNRKFVRMSLGGVRDEAEIRGHRRTYIGAMPGRILYGMKNAGSINPVFLLDEIDKVSSDIQGDPSSALLEVLDPEQNATFRDRFLEYPYDLSKVLFITTANTLDTIPAPLRDRMEIVQLSGYTVEEKTEIVKRYLVPKQLKANGLTAKNATFTPSGIRAIIEGYTREAGVRALERTVGSVCRKIAVQYAENKSLPKVSVDKKEVEKLLGAPTFTLENEKRKNEIGAVNGLAWTAVGGTTLTVEATTMEGKGEIKLTGKLGDVMKESALTALSYLRAHADEYGLDSERLAKLDLHIHVPEGATPKDGPSAGITIATAILSALTGKAVRGDIAMTGEITLRGKVLPIGGLKEKSLAARRVGIKEVVIPEGNMRDMSELPDVVKKEIVFHPVKEVDEVFALALEGGKITPKKRTIPVDATRLNDSVRC